MTLAVLTPAPGPSLSVAQVQVLFFGRVADVFGRRTVTTLPHEGCSVSELTQTLAARGPDEACALARSDVRVAVDQSIVDPDSWVTPGQEIAFFSMFSGG